MPEYVEITTHPFVLPEDCNFVMNQVMTKLHGVLRAHSLQAGIDFPHSTSKGLGTTLRIFSDRKTLKTILKKIEFKGMLKRRMIMVAETAKLPESATPVTLRRSRIQDVGWRKRKKKEKMDFLARKAEENGEVFDPAGYDFSPGRVDPAPYFLIEKNGNKYPVYFQPQEPDVSWEDAEFNSYGLGGGVFRF